MNVDTSEVAKFSGSWWDESSRDFKMLHLMNKLRMQYLTQHIQIEGKTILDIGCGGGIFAESLTRIGGKVTGLEPSLPAISQAKQHAQAQNLKISYINGTIETFDSGDFDIILMSDIIEHVPDYKSFLNSSLLKLKSGGKLFVSTINRTSASFLLAKISAEYIFKLVPEGTHEFKRFLKPEEINHESLKRINLQGFSYNPISQEYFFIKNTFVNYFSLFEKL